MKGKVLMIVMMGLLFLSFLSAIAEAAPGGLPECTSSLNTCTTNLGMCMTNLTTEQTNMATALTNLVMCQATAAQCSQRTPPPSWYQKLACESKDNCPRFEVLVDWGNEAVLDKETGLVWEKSPSTNLSNWLSAEIHCNGLTTGGRLGWRLPTLQELASLVDPSQSNPVLPAGHPFSNVQSFSYWSATILANLAGDAWIVRLSDADMGPADQDANLYGWCVRGGQGVDVQ